MFYQLYTNLMIGTFPKLKKNRLRNVMISFEKTFIKTHTISHDPDKIQTRWFFILLVIPSALPQNLQEVEFNALKGLLKNKDLIIQ